MNGNRMNEYDYQRESISLLVKKMMEENFTHLVADGISIKLLVSLQ